jgi:hypothetical protein
MVMSWRTASDPVCTDHPATPAIETIIAARKREPKEGRFANVPGETEFIPLPD